MSAKRTRADVNFREIGFQLGGLLMRRLFIWLLLAVLLVSPCLADSPPDPPYLHSVFSRNRKFEAVVDPKADKTTVYRLVMGGRKVRQWSMPGYYRAAFLDNDGRHLVIGYDGLNLLSLDYRDSWEMVRFYDRGSLIRAYSLAEVILDRKQLRRTASHYSWGNFRGIDKRGQFVIDTDENRRLVFDLATGRRVKTMLPIEDKMLDPELPTAAEVAARRYSDRLHDWLSEKRHFAVAEIAISPDGKYVLSGHFNDLAYLRDVTTGLELRRFEGFHPFCKALEFSHNGRCLLVGNQEAVRVLDAVSGKEVCRVQVPGMKLSWAVFAPDDAMIVTSLTDETIRFWNATTGGEVRRFDGRLSRVTFSRDGSYLTGVGSGRLVRLWNMADGREIRSFEGTQADVTVATISPDGKYVMAGGYKDGRAMLTLWETSTGRLLRSFQGHSYYIYSIQFTQDSRYALTASGDESARLWDVISGEQIRCFRASGTYNQSTNQASISPDEHTVITGGNDGVLRLWNVATGKVVRRF